MKAAIIILIVVIAVGAFFYWLGEDDCPRHILGYKCRQGDPRYPEGCDHSPEAVAEVKAALHL